jgi:transcriptional regulator with XRE-family HTH domain
MDSRVLSTHARRLKQRRLQVGMSITRLAALAKISPEQIECYEKGEEDIPASVLFSLARALSVTSDWLLGLSDLYTG